MYNKLQFYFIRHGKLDLPYDSHLDMPYELLDDIATSKLDPSITKNAEQLFIESAQGLPLEKIDIIYFNNSGKQSKRSKESAELIQVILEKKYGKKVPTIGMPELKEIDFSLKEILSPDDFASKGMPAVRLALFQAAFNQGPVEQIEQLFERAKNIFSKLQEHQDQTVLLVTHDFFMRVIDVYLQKTQDYHQVTPNDLLVTELNDYFKGFGVSKDLKAFKRI